MNTMSDLILRRPRSLRARLEGWPRERPRLWPSFETADYRPLPTLPRERGRVGRGISIIGPLRMRAIFLRVPERSLERERNSRQPVLPKTLDNFRYRSTHPTPRASRSV